VLWIGVIVLAVVPWGRFQDHSHWNEVDWIPFSEPLRVRDVVVNVLLYLPLGYWFRRQGGRMPLWWTVAFAFGLSVATDLTQVFSHGRFPSARDVTCNTIGALCGALWAGRVGASKAARDGPGPS
jgi:glycopeptide antibiotics resistance protein